jgi:hypothetical protein
MADLSIGKALQDERDQLRERLRKERENSNQELHNKGTMDVATIQDTGATNRTQMGIDDIQKRQSQELDWKTPERDAKVRAQTNETDFAQKYQDTFADKKLTAMDLGNEGSRVNIAGGKIENKRREQMQVDERYKVAGSVLSQSAANSDLTAKGLGEGRGMITDDSGYSAFFSKSGVAADGDTSVTPSSVLATPVTDTVLNPGPAKSTLSHSGMSALGSGPGSVGEVSQNRRDTENGVGKVPDFSKTMKRKKVNNGWQEYLN